MKFKNSFIPKILFGLLLIIKQTFSQLTDLPLGIEDQYIADYDKFFRIDTSQSQSHKNIVFHVSPIDNYENWSDPDIFLSKTYTYPSPYNNDWSSTRIGDDIIIIPTSQLNNTNILYAGVRCGKRCSFKIKAYYEDNEVNILEDQEFLFVIGNETETERIFRFYPMKNDKKYYELHASSMNLKEFEFSVVLQYKSIKREIDTINSGYSRKSAFFKPEFLEKTYSPCNGDCYYRILISGKPNSVIMISVNEAFTTKDILLKKHYMRSVLSDKSDCYFFNRSLFSEDEIKTDADKIIVKSHSYTQDVALTIIKDYKSLNLTNEEGRIDYNFKDQINFKLDFNQIIGKYLCLHSLMNQFTSYNLFVYKESDSEEVQKYNYLTNGVIMSEYLPANNVTTYKNLDDSLNSTSLTLSLHVIEGNPILFAYTCINMFDCHVTSANIQNIKPNLISTSKINDEYTIIIPKEENQCQKLAEINHQNAKTCTIISVVLCFGRKECKYMISMHSNSGMYLLQEKVKKSKYIKKNDFDFFKISNKNQLANKISIILHSHTGDADLYVSRTHQNPLDDTNYISSTTTSGNRDHIDIYDTINDINKTGYNSTLQGEYYIAVKGALNSFYSIYYFTSVEITTIDALNIIESGVSHSDVTPTGIPNFFRFFNPDKKANKPFIITAISLNCVGNFTVEKDRSYPNDSEYEILRSDINFKTSHNQIIIKPYSSIYNSQLYKVIYEAYDYDHFNSLVERETTCLFYLSANTLGKELMLNEGIPHILSFKPEDDLFSFNYVYPHIFQNKNPCLINLYFENKKMNVIVLVSFESNESTIDNNSTNLVSNKDIFLYNFIETDYILLKPSTLEKNCDNTFSCNIHISVKLSVTPQNTDDLTYKITARSNNLIPQYLKKNVIKEDYVIPNSYQYYFSDIKQNESGRVILKSKSASGILVGKIVRKNQPKEPNADFGNVALPTINYFDLKFNPLSNSLEFGPEETGKCYGGCHIYFGVYCENKEKFKDNINQFTITINTGNLKLNINQHFNGVFNNVSKENNIQYFTLEAEENKFSRITFNLNFQKFFTGKLMVNVGNKNENILLPNLDSNNYFQSETDCNHCSFDFTLNKQGKKFVIGVYIDPNKYTNITDVVSFDLYPADNSYINAKNFFEIKIGENIQCSTFYKNSYCDFLMILPNTDIIIFYTRFEKEFFNKYEEHFMDSVILANTYNYTEYSKLIENESLRPRLDNNPMYKSGVMNDVIKEYSIYPDNNILIIKNPFKSIAKENFNFNYNQTILCVSVFLQKPSSFNLLNNRLFIPSSVLNLQSNNQYLFYVKPNDSLEVKIPEYRILSEFPKNLQMVENHKFSLNFHTILGHGSVLYEDKIYKLNYETKNLRIIIDKLNPKNVKLNSYNDKNVNLKPYLCIVNMAYSSLDFPLTIGETIDVLYPSLYYPKKFYFLSNNMTSTINLSKIDLTFNYKILSNLPNVDSKSAKFHGEKIKMKLKSFSKLPNLITNEDENFNEGDYDAIHKVGLITVPLDYHSYYELKFIIKVENQTPEDEQKSLGVFNTDPVLIRVSFYSDNFLFSKSSLPYNIYYYSSILSKKIRDENNKLKNYHIHRLIRKHSTDKFFYIELGSCRNEFGYAISDYNKKSEINDDDYFLNKTNLKHEYINHYGKKIIEIELNDSTRDLILIVFPLITVLNKYSCQSENFEYHCKLTYYSDYLLRYRTSKSRIDIENYKLQSDGFIRLGLDNPKEPENLFINWGSVLQKNEQNEHDVVTDTKFYIIFFDAKIGDVSYFNSICYFDNKDGLVQYYEQDSFNRGLDKFAYNLKNTFDYTIAVIGKTKEDGTYLAYIPIYTYIGKEELSIIVIVFFIILTMFLIFIIFSIYRKYRLTKKRLDYEINDVRNMGNIPQENIIISSGINMVDIKKPEKYFALSESK